jgi:serine/threonine-protein kinase RsbW
MRQGDWQPSGTMIMRRRWASRPDLKQDAIDTAAEALVGPGWVDEADRSWLVLCLDEAITNAMLHGNEGDPRLNVEIAIACDDRRWHLAVSDQGEGFSMDEVPDPEDPASLLLEHGRGIRLMRAWLSALTYYRRGSTVVLSRRRADLTRT